MSISAHVMKLIAAAARAATGAGPGAAAATQSAATLPAPATPSLPASLITAALLMLPAALLAGMSGLFRPGGGIRTRDRLDADQSALPLLIITALGAGAWVLVQAVYGQHVAAVFKQQHPGATFGMGAFGAYDFAFLSTVPALVGLCVLVAGDFSRRLIRRLGYLPARLPRGVGVGILTALGVLPLMWGSGVLLDLLYRAIRFAHPQEHELLGAMKEAPPHVRWILIGGACIVAPVFEELLFRGHLQTLLGRIFMLREARGFAVRVKEASTGPAMPADASEAGKPQGESDLAGDMNPAPAIALDSATAPLPDSATIGREVPRRRAGLAILVTSLLFASVHPLWMAPLIFVLALCLGYLYERTGNLWACIAVHAIFNATSTITFLNL